MKCSLFRLAWSPCLILPLALPASQTKKLLACANHTATPFAALRQQYQSDKKALLAGLLAPQRRSAAAVRGALQRLTRLADRTLLQLWQAHHLHEAELALVAVGGFGRKELFPCSDIVPFLDKTAQTFCSILDKKSSIRL